MDVHMAVSGPPSSRVVKELRIYGSRDLGPKMGPEFCQPPALRPSAVYDTDSARPEPTVGCSGAEWGPLYPEKVRSPGEIDSEERQSESRAE